MGVPVKTDRPILCIQIHAVYAIILLRDGRQYRLQLLQR